MATSLVAALHNPKELPAVEVPVTLVGGHDGIFEVAVDGKVVYTNHGNCADGFPSEAEIVSRITDHLRPVAT